jgi:hypothetical protein
VLTRRRGAKNNTVRSTNVLKFLQTALAVVSEEKDSLMSTCINQLDTRAASRVCLISFLLLSPCLAHAATYNVTNTGDSGAGSLRQAMLNANSNPGADTITFNIPGAGPHFIRPNSGLPSLTGPTTIDGYTQSGAFVSNAAIGSNADIRIVLEGVNAGSTTVGITLLVGATDSTIRGLVINQFRGAQINAIAANCTIIGNYIGTDVTGSVAYPSTAGSSLGISATGANCRIGGSTRADRNVISGNSADGLYVAGNNAVVAGNIIGTNRLITAPLGNSCGISVGYSNASVPHSTGIVIGGNNAGSALSRNFISGNVGCGIRIQRAENLTIDGNAIGLSGLGISTIPNGGHGIDVFFGRRVLIGNLLDETADQFIVGNDGAGVRVIGGSTPPDQIYVAATSIYRNGGLAIDLLDSSGAGVTPNDPMDEDEGPNELQNFPVLNSATTVGSALRISGTLHSKPSIPVVLEFYANSECHPSGHGGGQRFLGFYPTSTNASGNATFTFDTTNDVSGFITATATETTTGSTGRTSEFSACLAVGTSDIIFKNGFEP